MYGYSIKELKDKSLEELIVMIKKGDIAEPSIFTYDLTTAQNEISLSSTGNFFGIYLASDSNVTLKVRFNKINSPQYTVTQGLYFIRPFDTLFLSWDAQAGKTLSVITSPLAPELFQIVDARSQQLQTSYLAGIQNNTRVLNGDTGTQINKSNNSAATTIIVHTVTAGKTFYLTAARIQTSFQPAIGGNSYLAVRNGADVLQYRIASNYMGDTVHPSINSPRHFPTPIKIPAGYDIYIVGAAGEYQSHAEINGWEE